MNATVTIGFMAKHSDGAMILVAEGAPLRNIKRRLIGYEFEIHRQGDHWATCSTGVNLLKHIEAAGRGRPKGVEICKAVGVRLSSAQRKWLEAQAREKACSASDFVRVALCERGMPE